MKTIIILNYKTQKTYLISFIPEFDIQEEQTESEAIESLIENKGLSINDCHYMLVDQLILEVLL